MIARARLIGVVGLLIAGATGLISSTQTWLLVSLSDGAAEPLAVAGASAVVLLAPLSLTALALGAALSIVGRILRPVFGVIGAVLGIALAILTAPIAIQAPVSAVSAEVAAVTGIRGESAIAEAGSMMYMTDGIQLETIFGDGTSQGAGAGVMGALLGAGKRLLTGESLFMTVFTNQIGRAHV